MQVSIHLCCRTKLSYHTTKIVNIIMSEFRPSTNFVLNLTCERQIQTGKSFTTRHSGTCTVKNQIDSVTQKSKSPASNNFLGKI